MATSYVIQAASSKNYARLEINADVPDGDYMLSFDVSDATLAAQFQFTTASESACALTAVAVEGSRSVTLDVPGQFVDQRYVYVVRPDAAAIYEQTPMNCVMGLPANDLQCVVRDQDVLQLYGSRLGIAAQDYTGQVTTFRMLQVV